MKCLNLIQLLSCTRFIATHPKKIPTETVQIEREKSAISLEHRFRVFLFKLCFVGILFYCILFISFVFSPQCLTLSFDRASLMFIGCLSWNTSTIIVLCQQNKSDEFICFALTSSTRYRVWECARATSYQPVRQWHTSNETQFNWDFFFKTLLTSALGLLGAKRLDEYEGHAYGAFYSIKIYLQCIKLSCQSFGTHNDAWIYLTSNSFFYRYLFVCLFVWMFSLFPPPSLQRSSTSHPMSQERNDICTPMLHSSRLCERRINNWIQIDWVKAQCSATCTDCYASRIFIVSSSIQIPQYYKLKLELVFCAIYRNWNVERAGKNELCVGDSIWFVCLFIVSFASPRCTQFLRWSQRNFPCTSKLHIRPNGHVNSVYNRIQIKYPTEIN